MSKEQQLMKEWENEFLSDIKAGDFISSESNNWWLSKRKEEMLALIEDIKLAEIKELAEEVSISYTRGYKRATDHVLSLIKSRIEE